MTALGLYTVFCEFRGGTYASQVRAVDEVEALRAWAAYMVDEKPIHRVSRYIARSALENLDLLCPPTPLATLTDVWCTSASCGGSFVLINIVRTAEPA